MARPQNEGLEYFPLDVDMDSDDKIEFIEAKFGLVAFGIVVRLLMSIYRNGYYMMWTERQQYVLSKRVNVDINIISNVVNVALTEGIFDKTMFQKYQILTSHGVQCRYIKACERRKKIPFDKRLQLFTEDDGLKTGHIVYKNDTISFNGSKCNINGDSTEVNVDINDDSNNENVTPGTQSKVKESTISTTTTTTTGTESGPDKNPAPNTDGAFAQVVQEYSNNIHPITPMEAEIIEDFLKEFTPEVIIKAIKRAIKRNGRSIGYVEGILKSWKANGIDDGEEAKCGANYKGAKANGSSRKYTGKPASDKGTDSNGADWDKFAVN